MFVLDRMSPVPLYRQIGVQFREQIESGRRRPGEPLPTNHEIQSALRVTYKTVQQAMGHLARDGLITRRRGKGTFVRPRKKLQMIGLISSIDIFDPGSPQYYGLMVGALNQQLDAQLLPHRFYLAKDPSQSRNAALGDLEDDIDAHRLAGLLVLNYKPYMAEALAAARRKPIPIVSMASLGDFSVVVRVDTAGYVRQAIDYLASRGRRRIGYIYKSFEAPETPQREQFLAMIRDAGLNSALCPTVACNVIDAETGYAACADLPIEAIDGLIITDDGLTPSVEHYLLDRGVNVPNQLAVATAWNSGRSETLKLPFDKFVIDMAEWAQTALDVLGQISADRLLDPSIIRVAPRLQQPDQEETLQ